MIYTDRKKRSGFLKPGVGKRGYLGRCTKEYFIVMDMYYILTVVEVPQVYTFVITYQTVYIKLYLGKIVFKT